MHIREIAVYSYVVAGRYAPPKSSTRKPAVKKRERAKRGKSQTPSFQSEIRSFVSHIESLSKALAPTMEAMVESRSKSIDAIDS